MQAKLALRWSLEHIAHRVVIDFPDDPTMRVWHETIYASLFVQARAALPGELTAQLCTGRVRRRPHGRVKSTSGGRGRILEMTSIHERPEHVARRARARALGG